LEFWGRNERCQLLLNARHRAAQLFDGFGNVLHRFNSKGSAAAGAKDVAKTSTDSDRRSRGCVHYIPPPDFRSLGYNITFSKSSWCFRILKDPSRYPESGDFGPYLPAKSCILLHS